MKTFYRALLLVALLLTGCAGPASSPDQSGQLVVTVQDGFTQQPLQGAKVVLAETGQSSYTDEDGRTEPLTLTFSSPQAPSDPDWGPATLLVYCEGYGDTLLLNVQVWPDQLRNGPLVLLFGPLDSGDPFVAAETPPASWSRALMDTFR